MPRKPNGLTRGGRRPGAGAPKGNLNGFTNGRSSTQVRALKAALDAVPQTAGLLQRIARHDRTKLQQLARGLHCYADILALIADPQAAAAFDLTQLRDPQIFADLIMQSINQTPANDVAPSPLPPREACPERSRRGQPKAGVRAAGAATLDRRAATPYPEVVTKIILWDVDMTLLYSGGAGSLAFRRAFEQLYGIPDAFSRVEFTGRTDWSIFRSGLEHHNLLDEADGRFERELRRFKERYFSVLDRTLAEAEGGRVMPGVPEALAALSNEDGRVRQGLATGNFRRAAFMKLRHFKLEGYLEEGGFGDDAEDRNRLVAIAIERMAAGDAVDPSKVWVIGDTLLDIEAAQSNGAHALAVATGPLSVDELLAQGADVAFEDLSNTEEVLRVLLGEGTPGARAHL